MKKIITIFSVIIALILLIDLYFLINRSIENGGSKKFAKEYGITENNIYVYKDINYATNMIEEGTGIVLFGRKDSKWIKPYAEMVNEVAIAEGIKKIIYVDITREQEKNSNNYKYLVYLLGNNLLANNNKKELFVPNLTIILDGVIIGNNNLSILESGTPEDFWTKGKQDKFKSNIKRLIQPLLSETCYTCR